MENKISMKKRIIIFDGEGKIFSKIEGEYIISHISNDYVCLTDKEGKCQYIVLNNMNMCIEDI